MPTAPWGRQTAHPDRDRRRELRERCERQHHRRECGQIRIDRHTSFDLPDASTGITGPAGSPKYTWQYDERHARIKQTRESGGNTRTTWYLHPDAVGGLAFESESNRADINRAPPLPHRRRPGLRRAHDHRCTAHAEARARRSPPAVASVTLAKAEYWHKDHLGSIAATSDQIGVMQQRYSYDPFGKRR